MADDVVAYSTCSFRSIVHASSAAAAGAAAAGAPPPTSASKRSCSWSKLGISVCQTGEGTAQL
eukprot:6246387-Prymnesium_polylepis.1